MVMAMVVVAVVGYCCIVIVIMVVKVFERFFLCFRSAKVKCGIGVVVVLVVLIVW